MKEVLEGLLSREITYKNSNNNNNSTYIYPSSNSAYREHHERPFYRIRYDLRDAIGEVNKIVKRIIYEVMYIFLQELSPTYDYVVYRKRSLCLHISQLSRYLWYKSSW